MTQPKTQDWDGAEAKAREVVEEYRNPPLGAYYTPEALIGMIARALLSARAEGHREGRMAGLEEAARVAYLAIGDGPTAAAKAMDIENAIRARCDRELVPDWRDKPKKKQARGKAKVEIKRERVRIGK